MNKIEYRSMYLSKHNSYDIPGMTQEEVEECLRDDFYTLSTCPICGKTYLGHNTICTFCGYDYYSDDVEECRAIYNETIANDPDYIWDVFVNSDEED